MTKNDDLILVGVISSAHGIKGDVLIKSYTTPESNLLKLPIIDKDNVAIKLKKIRINTKNELICHLDSCRDRNTAESLKGMTLYCTRENFPKPPKDEFYFEDLKNLKVLDEHNNLIGHIVGVDNYGAGDVIEIKFNDDGREEMFPFTKELFPIIEKDYVVFAKMKL